jgi:hypothetical protein
VYNSVRCSVPQNVVLASESFRIVGPAQSISRMIISEEKNRDSNAVLLELTVTVTCFH